VFKEEYVTKLLINFGNISNVRIPMFIWEEYLILCFLRKYSHKLHPDDSYENVIPTYNILFDLHISYHDHFVRKT
jgi:hypothetical protein